MTHFLRSHLRLTKKNNFTSEFILCSAIFELTVKWNGSLRVQGCCMFPKSGPSLFFWTFLLTLVFCDEQTSPFCL
jgi:hypothetical protein